MGDTVTFKTKVTISRPESPSVRTTIPPEVARALKLKNGDFIEWEGEAKESALAWSVRKSTEK
jgi:bifunctional DNA-binding transcriptional regulator/antitoxin component of YhaV-PrlF toxin-antitoxin module